MFSVFLFTQFYLPVCKNKHWHMHVVNLAAQSVEVLSSISLTRVNDHRATQLGCQRPLPKHFTHFFCITTWTLEHSHLSILMFLVKQMGKNIIRYILHCLISNCNCLSSLCFNQFHPIFV